jgi:endonuclease/exonuclease/phosphatase family metal-dependent hydrolase
MSRILLFFLLLTLVSCADPQTDSTSFPEPGPSWDSVKTPAWYDAAAYDTVSVLSWNIEHFVDDFDDPYVDHPRENAPDQSLTERRQLLADALKEMDADIVVFQEVESAAFVSALASEYFDELGYELFTSKESNTWYMNVVVMSRIPLGMLHSYANIHTFRREVDGVTELQNFTNNRMLSVEVHVHPEYHFLLTGVHLKAGRSEEDRRWRMGQIDVLHDHYAQRMMADPDARILLTGDLNIISGDPEYKYLLSDEHKAQFIDPLADVDSFTHTADNPERQLDYVLPNAAMAEDLVPGSKEILMPYDPETMRQISDHLPVIARFVTR